MNMKKILLVLTLLLGLLSLTSCNKVEKAKQERKEKNIILVGASSTPHAEILEYVKPLLAEKGYELQIRIFDDYVLPNTAVEEGELDANYFQHIAYLNTFNQENGTHLVYTAEIHLEPMGVFSYKYKSIDEIEDGATIAVPDDSSNETRALRVLEAAGLIELADSDILKVSDIISNPKNLQISELTAASLPRVLEEVDMAVINGNYALEAGLDVNENAFYSEDKNKDSLKERRNVLAVKEGTENSEKIKDLTKALTSDKVRDFINEKYKGAVVPVF
jgi:D-methionine transport system substrate-binding protein